MTAGGRFAGARRVMPVMLLVVAALATIIGVLLTYHVSRHVALDIGELGDSPFLSGFYADEPDITYRYRWTQEYAQVFFTGAGNAAPVSVVIRAQGARPAGAAQPVTMSVSLNGLALDPPIITLSPDLRDYAFQVPPGDGLGAPYTLAINAPTFRPPADARHLGIKIDRVQLVQTSVGLNLPPMYMLLWPLVLAVGLFVLPRRRMLALSIFLSMVGALLACLWISTSTMYAAAYLPWVAGAVGVAGLLVWLPPALRRWPAVVPPLVDPRPARRIMLVMLALYAVVALFTIPRVDWIGHADYAENAVVARNLVEGRGLVVDYVAQFYRYYPGITHPADTWPLLQPLLIAPFFVLFGPQTWAAKLPNLFVMLALAWGVFAATSRLWDSRVGLLAGLLVLTHPYFFNAVLYPINDLPFAAIFFGLAWSVWHQVSAQTHHGALSSPALAVPAIRQREADPISGGSSPQTKHAHNGPAEGATAPTWKRYLPPALTGLLAGLLIWSKPSGALLVLGLGLWAVWAWRRGPARATERLPWRALLVAGAVAGLVLFPMFVRNMLAFGVPFFTTESYDAWILRYWPFYQWENIYRVYMDGELPHPRWVVGGKFGYQNLLDAFAVNLKWVWESGVLGEAGEGEYVLGILSMLGAALGVAVLSRRATGVFGMVGASIGLYVAFVLVYWHFEGRYFQVAVPWLYMLIAWGLVWLWDRVRLGVRDGSMGKAGPLVLAGGVVLMLWPHLSAISEQVSMDTRPTGFVTTMRWLAENSTPADVVMTRDPWELNWYTRRRAVMIPYEDLPTIERIARMYGVTMLQLGGPVDRVDVSQCPSPDEPAPGSFPTGSRPALDGLYCGRELPGYKLVFRQGGGTIYRLEGD
jgi:hypothetical protein